jgi:hypothetical protein
MATLTACASFLDDLLHNLKDKKTELERDEESMGNSPAENDLEYLVEKYKASLGYFIQDVQAALDRMPQNNAAPAVQANTNNGNPSNPHGGKRKNKKTRKYRK